MVWAKVCIIGCKDLYISAYYRPHVDDNLSLELLDSALYKLKVLNKNAIIWISGDFNAQISAGKLCMYMRDHCTRFFMKSSWISLWIMLFPS